MEVTRQMGQRGESASGSRRTRSNSQSGPIWTVQDMLILVNEIAAVEGDCQNALSSFQKWNIIAENCTALEVVSNANQCRRKWQSLLADYNLVKDWELNPVDDSYWSLEYERKQEIGLPMDFDKDLYEAVDIFMKATERADTDPECDPEPEAEEVDVLNAEEFGTKTKRVRRRSTFPKKSVKGRKQRVVKEKHDKPVSFFRDMGRKLVVNCKENVISGSKRRRSNLNSTRRKPISNNRKQHVLEEQLIGSVPVIEQQPEELVPAIEEQFEEPVPAVEERHAGPAPVVEERPAAPVPFVEECPAEPVSFVEECPAEPVPFVEEQHGIPVTAVDKQQEYPVPVDEDTEQKLVAKVKDNSELVHAILVGDIDGQVDEELSDPHDEEMLKTERARWKADQLIACLADLANNLEQLCDVVEEC